MTKETKILFPFPEKKSQKFDFIFLISSEKTPAQLKKEAAKQAKLEKFQAKQQALKEAALLNEKKPKKAAPVS